LDYGEFLKMIEHDLPFTASTAQRLMKIAADPRMTNAARAQLLPSAWGTLYELTKLPTETFEQAAASGAIHPEMTRKDASRLVNVSITHERRPPVRYVMREGGPSPLPASLRIETEEAAPLSLLDKLERLENVVVGLSSEVLQHGDITKDIEKRIRTAANKLLSLIWHGRESLN
jgi:hypothetical protein